MKQIITILLTVMLVAGCSQEDNPLHPDSDPGDLAGLTDKVSPTVVNATSGEVTPYAKLVVQFSEAMNPETLNQTTVSVYQTAGDLNVGPVTGELSYHVPTYTLTFIPDASLPQGAFILTIQDSAKDIAGNPLDGNDNGQIDAPPLDYFRTTFFTAGGELGLRDIEYPYLTDQTPTERRMTDRRPIIQLRFAGGPMDTTYLNTNTVKLFAEGTELVPLERITLSNTTVRFEPVDPLQNNTTYHVSVNVSAMQDTSGNPLMERRNNRYYPYTENLEWKFLVADEQLYPTVAGIRLLANDIGFRLRFDQKMDVATLTTANIRVRQQTEWIYGSITIDSDLRGFHYYYPSPISDVAEVWLSATIMSQTGYPLDQNNNGIGGEPADSDWRQVANSPLSHTVQITEPDENAEVTNPVTFHWGSSGMDLSYFGIVIEGNQNGEWGIITQETTEADSFHIELPETITEFRATVSGYDIDGNVLDADQVNFTLVQSESYLHIIQPQDGEMVDNPVTVRWEVQLDNVDGFTVRWRNYNSDTQTWDLIAINTTNATIRTVTRTLTSTIYPDWRVEVIATDPGGAPLLDDYVYFILNQ